jgi:hypothetical protein
MLQTGAGVPLKKVRYPLLLEAVVSFTDAQRAAALLGSKGGKTKGPSKRRPDAHYARLAADKKAKAAKRRGKA